MKVAFHWLGLAVLALVTLAPAGAQDKLDPVIVPGKTTWPKAEIPTSILEYTAGKVVNYGNGGETNWYLIYCAEESQAHVDAYIDQYRQAGWKIGTDNTTPFAEKDNLLVYFQFYPKNKLLGIEIKILSTTKQWPVKEYSMLPSLTKCQSSDFRQNDYDMTVAVYKVSEADMKAYFALLVSKGWVTVDSGSFAWNKVSPPVELQIEDQGDGTYYFSLSQNHPDE